MACPLPVAKSNRLLSTANVDVLPKPSIEKPIQDAAWCKQPVIIESNGACVQRRGASIERPKNKHGNKPETICISNVFNDETFLLNKAPKGLFCVAPIVAKFLIQTCPETRKRRDINQKSAARF